MKLTFLGTGAAFTVGTGNYHSNMLLTSPSGRNLLIDCGSDARFSLYDQGKTSRDIHDVYISHLHADHVGGLEWLAFTKKFGHPKDVKPGLYLSEKLIDDLWTKVLCGGLSSLPEGEAHLSSYFEVFPVGPNLKFYWEGAEIELIKTRHVISNHIVLPSFGLFIRMKSTSCLITTDTRYTPDLLMNYYLHADLIFHDCETAIEKTGFHAHYMDLINLDRQIKQKTWLYHYQTCDMERAKRDGFKGFVVKGQSFDLE